MKFTIVNEASGREKLLKYLKDTQPEKGKECPTCKGWGKIFKGKERITCPDCKGKGTVKEAHVEFNPGECPTCFGKGYITKRVMNKKPWPTANKTKLLKFKCPKCKGEGIIKEQMGAGIAGAGTTSGSGFPTATDAAGGQAIDKFPTGGGKMARRVRRKRKNTQVAKLTNTFANRLLHSATAVKK